MCYNLIVMATINSLEVFGASDNAVPESEKVYPSLRKDPAYREMDTAITARTNNDPTVQAAMRDGRAQGRYGYEEAWDRANSRELLHGYDTFVTQYPQKAEAYAQRWRQYVEENPQVANMSNAEWDDWCNTHPTGDMTEYRALARIIDQRKRNAELRELRATQGDRPDRSLASNGVPLRQLSADETSVLAQRMSQAEQEDPKRRIDELFSRSAREVILLSTPVRLERADDEGLEAARKQLSQLPYFSGADMRDVLDFQGEDLGLRQVQTDRIIGSVSLAFQDWATEYPTRKGRVVEIAKQLLHLDDAALERIFHLNDPGKQVQLKLLTGPGGGEVYIVMDGSHRVAAAKLAGAIAIPAHVEDMNNLQEVTTIDWALAEDWRARIRKGLITGRVDDPEKTGGEFKLHIEKQVLPWAHLPSGQFIKFNQFYAAMYPGSLERTGIPIDALTDSAKWAVYVNSSS